MGMIESLVMDMIADGIGFWKVFLRLIGPIFYRSVSYRCWTWKALLRKRGEVRTVVQYSVHPDVAMNGMMFFRMMHKDMTCGPVHQVVRVVSVPRFVRFDPERYDGRYVFDGNLMREPGV